MVERAFEIIIQKRFQSLEDELRNGLNVQDTIRTSLSELFKTWQDENLLVSSQNLIQGYRQPAATENDTINSEQALPEFPDLDHSGSALPSDFTFTEFNSIPNGLDTLATEWPCIRDNNWLSDIAPLPFSNESFALDSSLSERSSQESPARASSFNTSIASSQDHAEPTSSTDRKGKGKARMDEEEILVPSTTLCFYCGGILQPCSGHYTEP
jgi:hypothetical protein